MIFGERRGLIHFMGLKLTHKRTKGAFVGAVSIVVSKFAGFALGMITTAVVVRYFSAEEFGLWAIFTFLIGLVPVLDLGLGLSLRNKLSAFFSSAGSRRIDVRRYFFSVFYGYIWLAALLVMLLGMLYRVLPWSDIFHTQSFLLIRDGSVSYTIGLIILVAGLPFSIGMYGFYSDQKTHWNSVFELFRSVMVVIFVLLLVAAGVDFIVIACAFGLAILLPTILSFFAYVKMQRWEWPRLSMKTVFETIRELLPQGASFGIMQFCATLIPAMQALIVGKVVGLKEAGDYALIQKLFLVLSVLHFAVLTPLWSAYTEAVVSRDIRWVNKMLSASVVYTTVLFTIGSVILYGAGKSMILIWTGKMINNGLLFFWMGVYSLVSGFVNCFSVFLNGLGKLRLQSLFLGLAAMAYFPVSFYLGARYGAAGICAASAVVILPLAISNSIQAIFTVQEIQDEHRKTLFHPACPAEGGF